MPAGRAPTGDRDETTWPAYAYAYAYAHEPLRVMPGDMARETAARARSQNAYKGAIGQTQTQTLHVTTARGDLIASKVYTSIDAVSDPELVERLYADTLNTLRMDGADAVSLSVPVIYHDPAAEVMVLVLGHAQRHREIDERIRVLEQLRTDTAPVPAYAKEFGVVFDGAGLRKYLESRVQQVLAARDSTKDIKDLDRRQKDVAARESELQRQLQELARSVKELESDRAKHEIVLAEHHRAQLELQRSKQELEKMRAEARARVIAAVQAPAEAAAVAATSPQHDDIVTKPIGKQEIDDIETSVQSAIEKLTAPKAGEFDVEPATRIDARAHGSNGASARVTSFTEEEKTGDDGKMPSELAGVEVDDEPTGNSTMPAGADPVTTDTQDLPPEPAAKAPASSTVSLEGGRVRVALVAGEQLAKHLTGPLDIRVLLHRMATYPVVTVLIGPAVAMRTPNPTQLAVLMLDVAADTDRAVIQALAKKFEPIVDVFSGGKLVRRMKLVAPLAENVAYIVRAADDHLRGISADGDIEASFERARDLAMGAGYDLLGVEHNEAAEFRDDKLVQLSTAQHLRRALSIARRFARPSREDYLVCARGYPLVRWRELRRGVLEAAVRWGLWMGPELAQIAVSEGLARSRRDLIMKLDQGFEALRKDQTAFDIDADAADDNAKEIAEEARALGVELRRKANGAIKSEEHSVVSGSIERTPPGGIGKSRSTEDLLKLLDDKAHRVSAATELCDRGDARAAAPVINAVKKMSRAEAVRILGKSVKFGNAAAGPLIEGLSSSKAFLRHGCALALALLRTDEGTHAVIDLLLSEPTEIWREIARAIGQIGPGALMPLASHVGRLGDVTPTTSERVAWAMAHVGVRGGKVALDQMANGTSLMAPIAKKALELHANAARDEVRVSPGQPNKDVTVNRAFSRRFFEALEADRPDVAQAALHDLDASGPLELDDSDLIVEEDEEEAELDESDLIQT